MSQRRGQKQATEIHAPFISALSTCWRILPTIKSPNHSPDLRCGRSGIGMPVASGCPTSQTLFSMKSSKIGDDGAED